MLWMSQWNKELLTVVDEQKLVDVDVREIIRGKIIDVAGKEQLVGDDFAEYGHGQKDEYEEYILDSEISVEINDEIKDKNFVDLSPNLIGLHRIPKPTLPPEVVAIHRRLNLTNPGHLGAPLILPPNLPQDIQNMFNKSWEKYQINEFGSTLIPLDRELPDMRTPYCKNKTYSPNLPMASCILVFHNEALSMILRTVYSLLNMSPPNLLREIILVDDCSTHGKKIFYL